MLLPDGRRLYTASCAIQTKWPSGGRTPLYIENTQRNNFRAPRQPLIRIRLNVMHERFNSFHVPSFAKPYKDRIANKDIILFKRTFKRALGRFSNFRSISDWLIIQLI